MPLLNCIYRLQSGTRLFGIINVMKTANFLKFIIVILAVFLIAVISYFIWNRFYNQPKSQVACTMEAKLCPDGSSVGRTGPDCEFAECPPNNTVGNITYQNNRYGFDFTLPLSWKGYAIVNSAWEGRSVAENNAVVETGPEISIRHPLWTSKVPRQDIPIFIFTTGQWNSLSRDDFHIGAAPINPGELGRNNGYVFALPARYNYAFPAGFEEVDQIMQNHPLLAFEPKEIAGISGTISGNVLLGPTCPVQRIPPDPNCADKPYATKLVLTTADNPAVVAEFSSDANGNFSVKAAPGEYVIRSGGTGFYPRCSNNGTIKISADGITTTTVFCDTGIR